MSAPKTLKSVLFMTAAMFLASSQLAQADTRSFIIATCGANCADPTTEQQAAYSNWSALKSMGTTQFIGSSLASGGQIDAASLLAGSRVAGAMEFDQWLRTGQASDPAVGAMMMNAMRSAYGIDVSDITGIVNNQNQTNNNPFQNQSNMASSGGGSSGSGGLSNFEQMLSQSTNNAVNSGNATYGPGGGGTSGLCDTNISSAQNASAQQYVNDMVKIATSGEYGFSQMGGAAISSGQRSENGYYGASCLDSLLQGKLDLLFKPPNLGQFLSMMSNMFGSGSGGSGGACGKAPSVMQQVMGSNPSGLFANIGSGGFFPFTGMGSENGASASDMVRSTVNSYGLLANQGGSSAPSISLKSLFTQ